MHNPVKHCVRLLGTTILVLFIAYPVTAQVVSAGNLNSSMIVGIVPVDDSDMARKAADFAYGVFQKRQGIALVERSELERIQRELALASTLASPAGRMRLGKTVGADFLLLIQASGDEKDEGEMSLRVVDCATGCVAAAVTLPTENGRKLRELLTKTGAVFDEKMRRLASVARSELIPVSIPVLNCLTPGSLSDEQAAERLRQQLLVQLGGLPGVVCLERDELLRAKGEMAEFKGKTAAFWNSAVIITGAAGLQGEGLRELFAALTLHTGNGSTTPLEPAIGDTREFEDLVQQLMAQIQEKLPGVKPDEESNGFDTQTEIALLTRLGTIYHLGGQYEKAQTVLENALALQPGEPTKKQRVQMAEILQGLQPNKGGRASPMNDLQKYLQWMENYIAMMEQYVKPWKYKYPHTRIVRNDVTTFFMRPPHQIRRLIKLRQGNPSYVMPEEYERIFVRREYLRELYREYVLTNLASGNVANEFNPLILYKNPDDIVTWYRNHWDTVLKQIAQSLAGQENRKSAELFFSEQNLRWHQRSGRDPLSENENERTHFTRFIVSRMRNFSAFKSAKYYTLPFSNAASVIDKLHQINRDAFDQLSTLLSLSEAATAFVLIDSTNLSNHLVGWPFRGGLATTREEFIQALRTLADILDNHNKNGEPHWIISEVLSTKESCNAASCILWATVHLLPQKRREALLKNWFIPKMTESPESALVSPLYSLMPTRRRLRDFVPGKHMDMPKHHELFRHPDANNPCFDLFACAKLRDYFAENRDTPSEETEFSIPLLEFYLTHRDEVKLDAQGERILSETLELAKKHSPRAAVMIARIERKAASGQDKPPAVDNPCLVLDQSIKTGKSLRFDEYDAPIDAIVHDKHLWMLWGGNQGFAFMELDLNKFNVVRAIPFTMRKPGTGKYVAQRRMTELNSVEWTTTENRIFIGHRDFLLMKTDNTGVEPFATASIPLAGKEAGATKSNESLSAYIQKSTPRPNASGRLPVPSKAAKKITAFCGTKGKIFFANSNGIFCWDESQNSLSLLASSHMTNGSSPLDSGTPYSVYWMGADVQRNRIILAIHEPKDGNPQIWGGLLGDRTGVWTYDLNNGEWRQLAKMTLGNPIPDSLEMRVKNDQIVFNSTQIAGRMSVQSSFGVFHRSSCGWKIGTHDPETQKWWQAQKPLPAPDFLKKEGMTEYKVIAHPYDDAWIYHQPFGGSTRKVIYASGRDAIEMDFAVFDELEPAKFRGNVIRPFKIFPVADGAVIWHLSRKRKDKPFHKLLYWKPLAGDSRRK